jgi:hypothetical protein
LLSDNERENLKNNAFERGASSSKASRPSSSSDPRERSFSNDLQQQQ